MEACLHFRAAEWRHEMEPFLRAREMEACLHFRAAELCPLTTMANNGYARAVNYLADCYYEGRNFSKNKEKAILLYLRAEKLQCLTTTGAMRLAQAFRDGDGMKADVDRADKLEKYKASETRTLLEMVKK